MSLSRFQAVAWTVVVLSAYLVHVAVRAKNGESDPLMVKIDPHLWALLGISTGSMVGSTLITSTKKAKDPEDSVIDKTAAAAGDTSQEVKDNRQGALYANTNKSEAKFTDLFQGDELINTTHIDLGKVQMFFFTVVALGTFVLAVVKNLQDSSGDLGQLPAVPEGLVAILGISHAGYLGAKSVTHTPVKQP